MPLHRQKKIDKQGNKKQRRKVRVILSSGLACKQTNNQSKK